MGAQIRRLTRVIPLVHVQGRHRCIFFVTFVAAERQLVCFHVALQSGHKLEDLPAQLTSVSPAFDLRRACFRL